MDRVIPVSWINRIVLTLSSSSAILCIIFQQLLCPAFLPIYVPVIWAVLVTIFSTWFSCFLLKLAVKANSPINIEPILGKFNLGYFGTAIPIFLEQNGIGKTQEKSFEKPIIGPRKVKKLAKEIDSAVVTSWYKFISDDPTFPTEIKLLLKNFLEKLNDAILATNKIQLANRVMDVLLLHLKEYRRAQRRVEKKTVLNLESAYRYSYAGSRRVQAMEHCISELVSIFTKEFLQWELTSSLSCKLLEAILAKKLFLAMETFSSPVWILENIFVFLHSTLPVNANDAIAAPRENSFASAVLSDSITPATAAVISHSIPKIDVPTEMDSCNEETSRAVESNKTVTLANKSCLSLEGLSSTNAKEHRTLWLEASNSEMDSELDDDKISPVYEEPTDFASTIARLRCLLQQKSTATTPMLVEEKSCVVEDQFLNLSIPWTEFYTAADGSQQLLYCIQFEDLEQRDVDTFETTTTTVRRQYSDFAQLNSSLEEIPSVAGLISDVILPEGGRVEMESYLKTLCTRLACEFPTQLRHFLRPNRSGKKADSVAPSFDRILAKIVSGTFNTLKTVVPGFEMESEYEATPMPTLMPLSDIPWRFVPDMKSKNVSQELQQLISERADYCSVDTAYEAVDTTDGSGDSESLVQWWEITNSSYDDEVDELDGNLSLTCTSLDLICEILEGIGSSSALQQEAVVTWTKFLFGNLTESFLKKSVHSLLSGCDGVTLSSKTRNDSSEESLELLKEKLLQLLEQKVPSHAKLIFGKEDTNKIFKFIIESLLCKKINQDLMMNMSAIVMSQLLTTCRKNHHRL